MVMLYVNHVQSSTPCVMNVVRRSAIILSNSVQTVTKNNQTIQFLDLKVRLSLSFTDIKGTNNYLEYIALGIVYNIIIFSWH